MAQLLGLRSKFGPERNLIRKTSTFQDNTFRASKLEYVHPLFFLTQANAKSSWKYQADRIEVTYLQVTDGSWMQLRRYGLCNRDIRSRKLSNGPIKQTTALERLLNIATTMPRGFQVDIKQYMQESWAPNQLVTAFDRYKYIYFIVRRMGNRNLK
ncbi:uncharacterized protein PADG_11557 [Paracoccidioides brasiliensis Pb18]|uniref:Uncharacterized protein n=1 Tax=Paracoccidioides brasiliensis (strain Pb18) TaxID=502780 RepID=A0A0A0HVH4_PARBD|nr:uncharacterized protein PADG_11557 [Paracoccidioides brasiliensis Pb18]KGM92358.1 hypothetical protein PADG_11557 [Paracoccidioides brasiliensis Pb18]